MCQDLKEEMEILATLGGLKQTGDITLGLCKGASLARFPFPAPGIPWESRAVPEPQNNQNPLQREACSEPALSSELLQEMCVWHH